MATYVLVHSAWLGAWSWDAVVPYLTSQGHRAVAVELPGHGEDKTPASSVTLEDYVRAVTDAVDAEGKAIVVGHSFGGIVASQAAEARPEAVQALVYLTAFLLPAGASFLAATEGVQGSMVLENLVMDAGGTCVAIQEAAMHEALAHDVPLHVFQSATPRMVAEPTSPLATPLVLTADNWGRVPRYYIECLEDHAIPPEAQAAMYTSLPVRRVFSMRTSHAPIFSAPEELAGHLMAVARDLERD